MSSRHLSWSRRICGPILAGVFALATAIAPVADPAQAAGPSCPTWTNSGLLVGGWATAYSNRGVALCEGFADAGHAALRFKLQIIDLSAGATIEQWQEYVDDPNGSVVGDERWDTKPMGTWASQFGVQNNPANFGTFSVTNAGFFTETSGAPSGLSFPSLMGSAYPGFAINSSDAGHSHPKRVLEMKWNGSNPQSVRIATFPTYYTVGDVETRLYDAGYHRASVGIDPTFDITGGSDLTKLRTYYGTNASLNTNGTKVYILSTVGEYTPTQATQILQNSGALSQIQMDGGASVQMGSFAGNVTTPGNRQIPQVIKVNYANN